jgi:hypothetical protein
MSELKIIDTVKRSFILLKKDPTIIVLFILPAIFPTEMLISNYLMVFILLGPPELPSMRSALLFTLYVIVGLFFGIWAAAGAVLKVTELEKGSKLGLKEALSRGLRKVPNLVVPTIAGLAIYILMIGSLTIAVTPYMFIGMSPLAQGVRPTTIPLRLAMGFLFVIGLYVATRLRLYAPACVLENNFGLKTSWKLVKGNWWKILAIFLIFGAMSAIINQVFEAMSAIISQAPVIGRFLSDLIVSPLSITAATLIYFQLRETKSSGEEHKESL